jgi:hypothetical protein
MGWKESFPGDRFRVAKFIPNWLASVEFSDVPIPDGQLKPKRSNSAPK